MKNRNINFYQLENSRTAITFSNHKKIKTYKIIIKNSIIIASILIIMFIIFGVYENNKIKEIAANLYESDKLNSEYMNIYSNNLKLARINYSKKYEILINKTNPLTIEGAELYKQVDVKDNSFSNIKIESNTYNNYLELKKAVESKGYFLNIRSGFRTFDESKNIYNSYLTQKGEAYAKNYVAEPGVSEHNAGLALDIVISKDKKVLNNNYQSDEYKYLENIAYLYGFIIRYPKGKEKITGYEYEPWHLRYVGKSLAKYLTKNNLTLEEYYEEKE